ncbi:MAG: FliI/YscN family ATPase [Pirellulales bacterium]|nr:FliI/YscN family ATPase [Pirellulales bacterium]
MNTQIPPHLDGAILAGLTGSVVQTVGLTAAVADFPAPVGALVSIERQSGPGIEAEVVGFRDKQTLVMPLGRLDGIHCGCPVKLVSSSRSLRVGKGLLGRVIDARGRCIDGRPQPMLNHRVPFQSEPMPPTQRPRIDTPLATGVRAIDGMLTCGKGQRLGIFSGSGVGKSVLLGMMSRYTSADVAVIALIGERGREVNEFIQRELGPAGLERTVVVVATSNEPALLRVQAAHAATSIAEYFRSAGNDVLMIMDSVTRFALAQREIGLSAGEPPTTRGFPPSAFAELPKLVERTGRTAAGSITAFYSVLVEGDDENEPIADTMRGLLDGHIWLARRLAQQGHYPAIDIPRSISRLMNDVASPSQQQAAQDVRRMISALEENEDLLSIGAYRPGINRELDVAVAMRSQIHAFLQQGVSQRAPLETVHTAMTQLAQQRAGQLEGSTAATAALPQENS